MVVDPSVTRDPNTNAVVWIVTTSGWLESQRQSRMITPGPGRLTCLSVENGKGKVQGIGAKCRSRMAALSMMAHEEPATSLAVRK